MVSRAATDKLTEVRNELKKLRVTVSLSLSQISKDEIEKMRRRCHLYIEWKCAEDDATPSSEAEPMKTRHLSRALNARRLKEFLVNDFPAPLKNVTIIS